jgi:hypothetical protein
MRVERLTALEIANADWAMTEQTRAAPAAHPAPERKRLILIRVAPQEKLSRAEVANYLWEKK